jgi:DNA-binding CsgD family transcriptional regulator
MFDLLPVSASTRFAQDAPAGVADSTPHPSAPWLAMMLDEIDYGMLLLSDESNVLHANHVAKSELDASHPLQLLGRQLRVRQTTDLAPLRSAIADATQRGLRRLVALGSGAQRITLAVVPLRGSVGEDPLTLLVFGKRCMCSALTSHWFARDHGLTPAETRILAALCEGRAPGSIAASQGVALSTVRSQIGSIRTKTGSESIRALVRQVAVLPPLVSALRVGTMH